MTQRKRNDAPMPSIAVEVLEAGTRARRGWVRCQIASNIEFNIEHLESYCFADWNPTVYDALLVAAAVEFADRTQRRPALTWQREISLRIPVHDPQHWSGKAVADALRDALFVLTGDRWNIHFHQRSCPSDARPASGISLFPADRARSFRSATDWIRGRWPDSCREN